MGDDIYANVFHCSNLIVRVGQGHRVVTRRIDATVLVPEGGASAWDARRRAERIAGTPPPTPSISPPGNLWPTDVPVRSWSRLGAGPSSGTSAARAVKAVPSPVDGNS